MASPSWLAYAFAVLMAVTGVYCVARLAVARRVGRRDEYDVDTCHVLMAIAMMGMLVPSWNVLPSILWQVVFAGYLAWFAVRAVTLHRARGASPSARAQRLHAHRPVLHAIMAFAMLDMYWMGMPLSGHGSSAMTMSGDSRTFGNPLLTLLIVVVLLGVALWDMDAIFGPSLRIAAAVPATVGEVTSLDRAAPAPRIHPVLSHYGEAAASVAMCVTMAFSLVLML